LNLEDLSSHAVVVFMGFFAIMNPVANTAIFVGLTSQEDRASQVRIAAQALLTSFAIIATFALVGKTIFHLFDITLPALRLTGGILLFVIGYQMLHGGASSLHADSSGNEGGNIAISPLAVPILAGPGTIATAMSYSASGDWVSISLTVAMFAALSAITFICFIFGQGLVRGLGDSGIAIVTRLMGLILAVIGTQMAMVGVTSFGT
jgi:multiple antibiotic resistance protein